nr:hypothetical protein [Tanacetum cinerariifolium]
DVVDEDCSEVTSGVGTPSNGSFPICATSISKLSLPTSLRLTEDCISIGVRDLLGEGKGDAWMFDLDYLTNSMNYEPISVENQANKSARPKEANNSVTQSSEA